jgi:hypothetical protein
MRAQSVIVRGSVMLCAACAAFAVTELTVALLVGYPRHPPPRIFHIDDRLGKYADLAWELPHSRIWNVEGGGVIHEYNNIGLSGMDVRTGPSSRYIFVLGDSYIEALQVPSEDAATSVFQRSLDSAGQDLQVINLGRRKSDPYSSWYRLKFFERYYKPSYIVLVMEQFYALWLSEYPQPLSFNIPASFGTELPRTGARALVGYLRMTSSLCNMLAVGFYSNETPDIARSAPESEDEEQLPQDRDQITEALTGCLRRFHEEYGPRFMVVSIGRDTGRDSLVSEFCRNEGIACETEQAISSPKNHIAGRGHLNKEGNYALGQFIYETYRRHRSDR